MENKTLELRPYPCLLFKNGRYGRNQIFFNIPKHGKKHQIKAIHPCHSHGWLFIWEKLGQCCLWNPATLELIQLPSLEAKQKIHSCILSSPPGNSDSLITIFFISGYLFKFCRVGEQQWTEKSVIDSDDDEAFIRNTVYCNGKLYTIASGSSGNQLVVIDQISPDGLVIHLHGSVPLRKDHSDCFHRYMVESCGEIFMIYLARGGKEFLEVTGVEVFKLDFSLMKWIEVESAKDRVFFLDQKAAYSCMAVKPETEGNRIYFTLADRSIYSFHIEENTVSVSLPYPDLKSPWSSPVWVIPSCRLGPLVHGEIKHELDDEKEEINPEQIKDIVPYVEGLDEEARETGYLCELPLDMLSSIASCLMLHDYMNFRLLNRTCRLVAPPTRIKRLARHSLLPWLMFCKTGEDKCEFIDPLQQERYLINNPNKSNDVRMCCSKEGWCLMVQKEDNVFLWNPFRKKIIPLPKSPHYRANYIGCAFLSSPDSSNCVLVLVCEFLYGTYFDYVNIAQGTWETHFDFDWRELKVSKHNNPVFYNEELYFLDSKGILTVFKSDVIWEVERPCMSFHQRYLLEANGKLLAVFMGFMGKWLRVFELNLSEMVWAEVDNVGDMTLYLSRISSFAIAATTEEMKNTICFPRFCGDNLVYYSLQSRKYHCYGSNAVLEDFYNTKEQLYCGWIDLR